MAKDLRIELSAKRINHHSFLVALIALPELPANLLKAERFTQCAVVGVNDVEGNEIYGAVELDGDEKDAIGNKLADKCVKIGVWVWCNIYA